MHVRDSYLTFHRYCPLFLLHIFSIINARLPNFVLLDIKNNILYLNASKRMYSVNVDFCMYVHIALQYILSKRWIIYTLL